MIPVFYCSNKYNWIQKTAQECLTKKVIFNALCVITKIECFLHVWLNDDAAVHILNEHYTSIMPSNLDLTSRKLNAT